LLIATAGRRWRRCLPSPTSGCMALRGLPPSISKRSAGRTACDCTLSSASGGINGTPSKRAASCMPAPFGGVLFTFPFSVRIYLESKRLCLS
jgi:hypothetical protein